MEKIAFREARQEDAEFFTARLNADTQTKRNLAGWVNSSVSVESEREYLKKHAAGTQDGQHFCIKTMEGRLIGSCSIFDWEPRSRKCAVGIFIADPSARGKGYGGDTLELLLLIAFTELNCRKVKLNVFSWNERAIRLYEKKGFVREEAFTGGKWHDEYCCALFRDAWLARVCAQGRPECL